RTHSRGASVPRAQPSRMRDIAARASGRAGGCFRRRQVPAHGADAPRAALRSFAELDGIAHAVPEERARNGGLGRDHVLAEMVLALAQDPVRHDLAAFLEHDLGAEAGDASRYSASSTKRAREMRFCSEAARVCAFRCLSFAEWYSAFSLRSPSSRARWIVCGIVVRSSRSRSSSSFCSRDHVARVITGTSKSSACSPTWLKSASVFFWRWSSTHCFSSGKPTFATASRAGNR